MKEIKVKKGYYLTQSTEVADNERRFITAIKGATINESDWREATADEKESFMKSVAGRKSKEGRNGKDIQ